jgi:hypothetical protein
MGGDGKIVEVDEALIGFQEGANKKTPRVAGQVRNVVMTLVERGGRARSFHIEGTTLGQLIPIIRTNISRESHLMTDEATSYTKVGKEFASPVQCHRDRRTRPPTEAAYFRSTEGRFRSRRQFD